MKTGHKAFGPAIVSAVVSASVLSAPTPVQGAPTALPIGTPATTPTATVTVTKYSGNSAFVELHATSATVVSARTWHVEYGQPGVAGNPIDGAPPPQYPRTASVPRLKFVI